MISGFVDFLLVVCFIVVITWGIIENLPFIHQIINFIFR